MLRYVTFDGSVRGLANAGLRWISSDRASLHMTIPRCAIFLATIAVIALVHHAKLMTANTVPLITISLVVGLWRMNALPSEANSVRLLQLIGMLAGLYSLIHYPMMPVLAGKEQWFGVLLIGWILSLICGAASLRKPILGLVPAAYLVWSVHFAENITGLNHRETLDILPLYEVAVCLAVSFAVLRTYRLVAHRKSRQDRDGDLNFVATSGLMLAISIHLANYFWSSVAKFGLEGPFMSWVTENNPLYIFLAAIDDGHIVFSQTPIAKYVAIAMQETRLFSNAAVFALQAVALIGFLMPKRALIILLLAFDAMHILIAIFAGANFWPWIILNAAIIAVVSRGSYKQPRLGLALGLTVFILFSAKLSLAGIAKLGWYDSGANNKIYFQAEDTDGKRYTVSPNFFMFYSYPFAHMNQGMPQPNNAFQTGAPNGGAWSIDVLRAGQDCNAEKLIVPGLQSDISSDVAPFIRMHHAMALDFQHRFGFFPANYYPHHFFARPALGEAFAALEKDRVVKYIMRRESVCLTFQNGEFRRKLVNDAEYHIPIQAVN